jgi:hypothetical protein
MSLLATAIVASIVTIGSLVVAKGRSYQPADYQGSGVVVPDPAEGGAYMIRLPAFQLRPGDGIEPHFQIANGPQIDQVVVALEVTKAHLEELQGAEINIEVIIHPAGVVLSDDAQMALAPHVASGALSSWKRADAGNGAIVQLTPPNARGSSLRAGTGYDVSINLSPLTRPSRDARVAVEFVPVVMSGR